MPCTCTKHTIGGVYVGSLPVAVSVDQGQPVSVSLTELMSVCLFRRDTCIFLLYSSFGLTSPTPWINFFVVLGEGDEVEAA